MKPWGFPRPQPHEGVDLCAWVPWVRGVQGWPLDRGPFNTVAGTAPKQSLCPQGVYPPHPPLQWELHKLSALSSADAGLKQAHENIAHASGGDDSIGAASLGRSPSPASHSMMRFLVAARCRMGLDF